MTGISRTRSRQRARDGYVAGYKLTSPAGIYNYGYLPPVTETCTDVVGNPFGENPFSLTRNELVTPCTMTGGTGSYYYKDYACAYSRSGGGSAPISNTTGTFRDRTQATAAMQPSSPLVELPNFAFELKDIPDMLRHAVDRCRRLQFAANRVGYGNAGKTLHRDVLRYANSSNLAEDYLNLHFGWVPFFSDLSSILGLTQWTERRQRALNKLRRNGYIRTTAQLGSRTGSGTSRQTLESSPAVGLGGTLVSKYIDTKWVSAKWIGDPVKFGEALNSDRRAFLNAALGMDFNVVQLWNAIPWSWLTDWFVNVDAILTLKGNRQGIRFHSACEMHHEIWESTCTPDPNPVVSTSGPAVHVLEKKTRTPFSPSLTRTSYSNILNDSQLTTLAALKVTRTGKGASSFY